MDESALLCVGNDRHQTSLNFQPRSTSMSSTSPAKMVLEIVELLDSILMLVERDSQSGFKGF